MGNRRDSMHPSLLSVLEKSRQIADVRSIRRKDYSFFGFKNANLGELASIRMNVPEGFALSVEVFSRFINGIIQHLLPKEGLDHTISLGTAPFEAIVSLSGVLRRSILRERLPSEVERGIQQKYDELCEVSHRPSVPVAVRSSALSEDSMGASFAGVFDTFLWIAGWPKVLQSIKRCYASMFSEGALDYRRAKGMNDSNQMLMSVGVLRMINARSGGTLFSQGFSRSEKDLMTIHSNWGLPATVVDGNLPVDSFEIAKSDLDLVNRS